MENYLNLAAQIIYRVNRMTEPTCKSCGTILCEAEEKEGRCSRCSEAYLISAVII